MISDYRYTAINTLTQYAEEFPEMSFGEMLYTFLKKSNLEEDVKMGTEMREILLSKKISDKQFYQSIEKALKDERE